LLEQNNFICSVDCNREIAVSDASSASDFNFSKFSFNRVTSEDETNASESSFCAVVDFLFVVDFLLPPPLVVVVVFFFVAAFVVPFSPSSIEEEEEESIEESIEEDARIREIGLLIFFPILIAEDFVVPWRIITEEEEEDDNIFIDNDDAIIIIREGEREKATR